MRQSVTTLGMWVAISSACLPAAYAQDTNPRMQQLHFQVQTPLVLKSQGGTLERATSTSARECDADKPDKGKYDRKKRYGYGHGYGKRQ